MSQFDRRSSLERTSNSDFDSPLKEAPSFNSTLNSPLNTENLAKINKLNTNQIAQNRKSFVSQIDSEYKSTGAWGFLRLNGLFSNHVNKKLNVDSDVYHSMNMLGQKRTILNKLRSSIANNTLTTDKIDKLNNSNMNKSQSDPIQGKIIDNYERRAFDNISIESEKNRMILMYNRCAKHENWKHFQTKRYINSRQLRYISLFINSLAV